jgi:hypothetical protein
MRRTASCQPGLLRPGPDRSGLPQRPHRLRCAPFAYTLACLFGATWAHAAAEPWVELGKLIGVTVYYDAQSVRPVDQGAFEVSLLYQASGGVYEGCRNWPPGECGPGWCKKLETIRIRCDQKDYQLVDAWYAVANEWGGCKEDEPWRHGRPGISDRMPGWKYDIEPRTVQASAFAVVCGTSLPAR